MVSRKLFLISASLLVLLSINFASASSAIFNVYGDNSMVFNRTAPSLVHVEITSESINISEVTFLIQGASSYVADSNYTNTTIPFDFISGTAGDYVFLNFTNATNGVLEANSSANFSFQIIPSLAGTLPVVINTTGLDNGVDNSTTWTYAINFAFAGTIKNASGVLANETNVSLYRVTMVANGPPTEVLEAQEKVIDANAGFTMESLNGTAMFYKIKVIQYSEPNPSTHAIGVGAALPYFPSNLFYPGANDFSLNGSSLYLQPAATINITAYNCSTGDLAYFGYEVIDQKVGFPVESNTLANVMSANVIVPTGRDYSVMVTRQYSQFTYDVATCGGLFFGTDSCPAPPITNSTLGTLSAGDSLEVSFNLSYEQVNLTGCISIGDGANNTDSVNITSILLKMIPFSTSKGAFIPPARGDLNNFNFTISNVERNIYINYTSLDSTPVDCTGTLAYYNIPITTGRDYLIEVYAKNASVVTDSLGEATESGSSGDYLAAFQNISVGTENVLYNLTLYKLSGIYIPTGVEETGLPVNTSLIKVNILNESGAGATESMHVEVSVKNSQAGTGVFSYMIETLSNGTFYLPILNNSDWARVSVYPNNAPPMTQALNLSVQENNITLVSVGTEGSSKGLKQMNSSGSLESIDSSAMPFEIKFLMRGTDIEITSMNASAFNPLKALVAGNVDLELKVKETGVITRFNNFDMFSAKQPPMFAIMDNRTLNSSSGDWNFGNFVPKDVYDNVTITIPYDESALNETWAYNMSIASLYTESQTESQQLATAWNATAGDTQATLTDEFAEYNTTKYRGYLDSGGVVCTRTNDGTRGDDACYMDLLNNQFVMEIPHFSGISSAVTATDNGGGVVVAEESSGGGSATPTYWTGGMTIVTDEQLSSGFSKELSSRARMRVKIGSEEHYVGVVSIASTTAVINVSSIPQQATFSIGDSRRFELTNDTIYDLLVTLNGIANAKVNLTVLKISEQFSSDTLREEQEKENQAQAEAHGEAEAGTPAWVWVVVVAIVAAIGVVLFILYKKKRKFW